MLRDRVTRARLAQEDAESDTDAAYLAAQRRRTRERIAAEALKGCFDFAEAVLRRV